MIGLTWSDSYKLYTAHSLTVKYSAVHCKSFKRLLSIPVVAVTQLAPVHRVVIPYRPVIVQREQPVVVEQHHHHHHHHHHPTVVEQHQHVVREVYQVSLIQLFTIATIGIGK